MTCHTKRSRVNWQIHNVGKSMMTRTTKRVCDEYGCSCTCDLSDKLLAQCVWLLGYRHEVDFMNIICVHVNLMVTVYICKCRCKQFTSHVQLRRAASGSTSQGGKPRSPGNPPQTPACKSQGLLLYVSMCSTEKATDATNDTKHLIRCCE